MHGTCANMRRQSTLTSHSSLCHWGTIFTLQSPRFSPFDLPPGGVHAATHKLQQELETLRAMKSARLTQGGQSGPGRLPPSETAEQVKGHAMQPSSANGTMCDANNPAREPTSEIEPCRSSPVPRACTSPGQPPASAPSAVTQPDGAPPLPANASGCRSPACAGNIGHGSQPRATGFGTVHQVEPLQAGAVREDVRYKEWSKGALREDVRDTEWSKGAGTLREDVSYTEGSKGTGALLEDMSYKEWSNLTGDPASILTAEPSAGVRGAAADGVPATDDVSYEQWCKQSEPCAAAMAAAPAAAVNSIPPCAWPAARTSGAVLPTSHQPSLPHVPGAALEILPVLSQQQQQQQQAQTGSDLPTHKMYETESSNTSSLVLNPLPSAARASLCLPSSHVHPPPASLGNAVTASLGNAASASASASLGNAPASLGNAVTASLHRTVPVGIQGQLRRMDSSLSTSEAGMERKKASVRFAQEEASSGGLKEKDLLWWVTRGVYSHIQVNQGTRTCSGGSWEGLSQFQVSQFQVGQRIRAGSVGSQDGHSQLQVGCREEGSSPGWAMRAVHPLLGGALEEAGAHLLSAKRMFVLKAMDLLSVFGMRTLWGLGIQACHPLGVT